MKSLLFLALALGGCATTNTGLATPVQVPSLPSNLSVKAGPLEAVEITSTDDLVRDYGRTITKYNSVANQTNALIDIYNCIRVAINEGKAVETCE